LRNPEFAPGAFTPIDEPYTATCPTDVDVQMIRRCASIHSDRDAGRVLGQCQTQEVQARRHISKIEVAMIVRQEAFQLLPGCTYQG
jgi:hypothetical protein